MSKWNFRITLLGDSAAETYNCYARSVPDAATEAAGLLWEDTDMAVAIVVDESFNRVACIIKSEEPDT